MRAFRAMLQSVSMVLVGILASSIYGCESHDSASLSALSPIPSLPRQQMPPSPRGNQLALADDLIQGLSSEQVIKSFPAGRPDPFSLDNASGSAQKAGLLSTAEIKAMIKDFQVMGVMRVAGRQAVFVTFQGQSGEVYPGQVGGKSTPFLPPGWRLVAIRVDQGRIELASNNLKAFIDL